VDREVPPLTGPTTKNCLTIDLEEWHRAFDAPPPEPPEGWPSRTRAQLAAVLDLLDEHSSRATFFVVGELAMREPWAVREIASRGHEVACHGYSHRALGELGRERFRQELKRAVGILGELSGRPVRGFRAPWFSLCRSTWWALEELAQVGVAYDSSLFPVWNPVYGSLGVSPFPHRISVGGGRELLEIPPAPTRLWGLPLPAAGGFWLRNAPRWFSSLALHEWNRKGHVAVLYIHPWELDPDQPLLRVRRWERIVHYSGLGGFRARLSGLMLRSRFGTVEELFGSLLGDPAAGSR
jgi:polysaccharide deacetylase family protein (PEP-CTERM system associated)